MATILRVLTLLAVLLLPFGMQPTAAAPAMDHHAAMAMEHCPDQAPSHDRNAGFAECTMACSAALPVLDATHVERLVIVCAPSEAAAVRILHGLHPDTVTPPPKRA